MNIKRAYFYFFYKLYKFWECVSVPKFWSEWKALLSVMVIELWLLASLGIYYTVITKKGMVLSLTKPIIFIPLAAILVINYLTFLPNNIWEQYVQEFDKISKKKNNIWGFVVWVVILAIIANFIFYFYLMSRIDWRQYR